MKSIQANFNRLQRQDSTLGNYQALAGAIRYKKCTRRTIRKNLFLLGDEFDEPTKKQLVEQLYRESQKDLEECNYEGKNPQDSFLDTQVIVGTTIGKLSVLQSKMPE